MKKTLLAVCMLLALTVSANAAIIWTSWDPAVGGGTGLQTTSGSNNPLTFNQFNSGLGTLLQVEFELTGYAEAGYRVDNEFFEVPNAEDLTFLFQGVVTVLLQNPLGGNFVTALPTPTDIERTIFGPGGFYETPDFPARTLTDTETKTGKTSVPANLALFNGPGTINLNTSATIAAQLNTDLDNTSSVSSRYSANGRIRYQYDDGENVVPEPTSMVLGGSALLGLGLLRRRYAKK